MTNLERAVEALSDAVGAAVMAAERAGLDPVDITATVCAELNVRPGYPAGLAALIVDGGPS